MLFQLSIAATLLAFLTFGHQELATQAQVPFPRQCPVNVKVMDTFNLDAYMGIWYEHSKYPFVFEIGKKCMYARYENQGNDTVSVMNAAVNRITGQTTNVTGKAKVLAPAQLAVQFSRNQNPDKANYLVLGSDYTTYAVVYSCTNITSYAHTKIVWILTRERKPTQETINAAKKVLDDNNLSQTFLLETIQNDSCPEPLLVTSDTAATVDPPIIEAAINDDVDADGTVAVNILAGLGSGGDGGIFGAATATATPTTATHAHGSGGDIVGYSLDESSNFISKA